MILTNFKLEPSVAWGLYGDVVQNELKRGFGLDEKDGVCKEWGDLFTLNSGDIKKG